MPSAPKITGAVLDLHQLVRDGDVQGILDMERKCAPDEWKRALCGRDDADHTPLAAACTAWNMEVAKTLLSLGSVRSIFVRGFQPAEILCTLPYVSVVPDRHGSLLGRAFAEQRQEQVLELATSGKERETEALKEAIDSSLAEYILSLAAGSVEVSPDDHDSWQPLQDDASASGDASASKASTAGHQSSPSLSLSPSPCPSVGKTSTAGQVHQAYSQASLSPSPCPSVMQEFQSRATMCVGDLVRLKPGLAGSTVMISQRGTDNYTASVACLGAAEDNRLGLIISSAPDSLFVVASLSSGHVCEYHQQDLVFADGTTLAAHPRDDAGRAAGALRVGDLVTLAKGAFGSSVDDPSPHRADKNGGCCVVTASNFAVGRNVVRGPDWDWEDEDGGEGKVGVTCSDGCDPHHPHHDPQAGQDLSAGWVRVKWGGATSTSGMRAAAALATGLPGYRDKVVKHQYRVTSAADLKYHKDSCVCCPEGWRPMRSIDEATVSTAVRVMADEKELKVRMERLVGYRFGLARKEGTIAHVSHDIAMVRLKDGNSIQIPWDTLLVQEEEEDAQEEGAQEDAESSADKSCLPSLSAPAWMPAADQILVVSSVFHAGSSRGLVVSRLDDASQPLLARASDLRPASFPNSTYTFKRGEMVRLQPSALVCHAKCLGSPADQRLGLIVFEGTGVCNGFQRNIEVAVVQDELYDAERGQVVVSLYSALDLAPASLYDYTGTPSKIEAEALVEKLAALGKATHLPLQADTLVDMFGLGVWDRLWSFFVGHGVYVAAFRAYCEFQKSRPKLALDARYQELLLLRRQHERVAAHALDSAATLWSATLDVERVVEDCAAMWSCAKCCTGNSAEFQRCQVCASSMPTFKCGMCLQVNAIINVVCKNCLEPNPRAALTAQANRPSHAQVRREGAVREGAFDDILLMDDAGVFDASDAACAVGSGAAAACSSSCNEGGDLLFGYRVQIASECELNGKIGRVIARSVHTEPAGEKETGKKQEMEEKKEEEKKEPKTPVASCPTPPATGPLAFGAGFGAPAAAGLASACAFAIGDVVRLKGSDGVTLPYSVPLFSPELGAGLALSTAAAPAKSFAAKSYVVEKVSPMVSARCTETGAVTKFFAFSLEKVHEGKEPEAHTSAPAPATPAPTVEEPLKDGSGETGTCTCAICSPDAYVCEICEGGKSRFVTLEREQLRVLSCAPSNLALGAEVQAPQALQSPWQRGALVRLAGNVDQALLSSGRLQASVGCIASVNRVENSVRITVAHGVERRVSHRGFKVGDAVRLCPQYTSIGDAAAGPMIPGKRGRISACREGLVLVEALEVVIEESQEAINNRWWWYGPDALVHAELLPSTVEEKKLGLDKVMRSSSSSCGVFFDIANTSHQRIKITGIVAGSEGSSRGATLYACRSGDGTPLPCKGHEMRSSSWHKVGAGQLRDKEPSSLMLDDGVVLQPGQVQGFLLHSTMAPCGVFKVGDLVQLAEGYATVSDASSGPMKPGDVGTVVQVDHGPSGFGAFGHPTGAFGASVSRSVQVQVKQGFHGTRNWHYQSPALKHAGGVRCSQESRSFGDGDIKVSPWHATCSSSPFGADYQSRQKCCLAGEILYEHVSGFYDASEIDLKHLRIVREEHKETVPVVVLNEFISNIRKHEATRQPSSAASAPALEMRLAGGYQTGDRVRSSIAQDKVQKGDVGTVVGPYTGNAADKKEDLVCVDFGDDKGRLNMLVKTQIEYDGPLFPEDEADINVRMAQEARCLIEKVDKVDQQEVDQSVMSQCLGSALDSSTAQVAREDSTTFYRADCFEVLSHFKDMVAGRDTAGNTVAHHLAMADMPKSLEALLSQASALKWLANDVLESPQMLCDGIRMPTKSQAILHRAIHEGRLLQVDTSSGPQDRAPAHLVRRALLCAADYTVPREVVEALAQGKEHVASGSAMPIPQHILRALQMMMQGAFSFSPKQVNRAICAYLEQTCADGLDVPIPPLVYLVRFWLYKKQASKSKVDRQREACALAALECFPAFASQFLSDSDREGARASEAACLADPGDEDEDEEEEDFGSGVVMDAASEEWKTAKADHGLVSTAMDQLMGLTGLGDIKKKAMGIVKEVLLQKVRPASVKADTSMNFLFVGNPGCGKTTVARLIAKAMSELGFRSNPQMLETSAQDILKLKDPASEFAQMFDGAKGGTIFIDEAYRFSPAGAGSQPNASNQVLDFLLEAVEKPEIRDTTTVILAGYSDEIEDLLAYNVGFSSRFPLKFAFEDYSESQLRQIFVGMVKGRGMRLESSKACGVSISSVMAARIHQGAGKKGFGNARAVRNKLEQVITAQSQRIGTRRLRKLDVSDADFKTLTALDALGPRPNFSHCQPMRAMEAMVGLGSVKAEFRKLVSLSQQNYDREMRGDKPEQLSLHRVFYGNPGTGKTTVARMYGALLKELGLLSKGDFISVTPADLTGDAEGGAASNTKAVLERAKGKVLLIDEAYVLDPRRKNNQYGGNVLDTLVEKLDGEAGSDIAVVLAGYKQEMYDMLDNNAGLRRRFNIDDFGIHFTDFSDEELKAVLISMAAKCGLVFDDLELVDAVVSVVGQKRRLPGFGNAGTVASMLNFAKAAKAGRLQEAQQVLEDARRQGTPLPVMPDPDVLIRRDFIPEEEADPAMAREAFANLYNTDHIVQVLDKLEALIVTAKEDGRDPADVLADSHMVFVGPPGTGKTTVAQSFGKLFKDLKILPSDNVTTVTGTSLMGQYVGETKEKVLKAMRQARGGILFIDEAYGMSGSSTGSASFGREAIDTLVGSMTSEEFKGNLLVIMAGYEQQMDALFANANAGFASRFNKKRVVFKPWTAQQAADAVVAEVQKSGKSMTAEAQACLGALCHQLQPLPLWGSARDVFETILPNLYTERASRLYGARLRGSSNSSKEAPTAPYEADDVEAALNPVIDSRRKMALETDAAASFSSRCSPHAGAPVRGFPQLNGGYQCDGTNSCDSADGMCAQKPKLQVKQRTRRIDDDEEADDDGEGALDVWAALEQACRELGYTEERVAEFLGDDGDYPDELLARIMSITSCDDAVKIRAMLDSQKGALLARMLAVIEYKKKVKSEEEAQCQQALREMGRCPMDYEWLKEEGGWRCAGGSHYVSDDDVASLMK